MNFKINPILLTLVVILGILIYHLRILSYKITDSYNSVKRKINNR